MSGSVPILQLDMPGSEPALGQGAQAEAKAEVYRRLLELLTEDCPFTSFVSNVLLTVMNAVRCEASSLLELDPAKREFFFRASVGQTSDQMANFTVPWGKGVVGHVAQSRQPYRMSQQPADTIQLKTIDKTVGFETRSMLAFPVIVRGEVFGVLELLNKADEPNFSDEDMHFVGTLMDSVSRAIEIRLMLNWVKARHPAPSSGGGGAP